MLHLCSRGLRPLSGCDQLLLAAYSQINDEDWKVFKPQVRRTVLEDVNGIQTIFQKGRRRMEKRESLFAPHSDKDHVRKVLCVGTGTHLRVSFG